MRRASPTLQATRFRQLQAVADAVASRPGIMRKDLAKELGLSERQLQTILTRLAGHETPVLGRARLRRNSGYRFELVSLAAVTVSPEAAFWPWDAEALA